MTINEMPSRIAMKCPFAQTASKTELDDYSGNSLNYPDGFSTAFETPVSQGGRYVARSDMNALGYLATNDQFYFKCGGLNTYDSAFAQKIGGYPKGAILEYLDGVNYYNVISLVDNNLIDFTDETIGVDTVNWAYCNVKEADTGKTLVFETTQQIEATPGGSNLDATYFGVFRAPKSGVITVESEFTHLLASGTDGANTCGVGLLINDLGTSYTEVPKITGAVTANGWNLVRSSGGNLNVQDVMVLMKATYGHYYAVGALSAGAIYSTESFLLAGGGVTYTRYIVGTDQSTKIYIS